MTYFKHAATAAAFIAIVGLAPAAHAQLKSITIGSNPAGSVYFLLAGGFAKLFQEKLKIRSTAQPHAGSSVYLPLMQAGEITAGVNSSLDMGMAFSAKPPYRTKHTKVYALARCWVLPYGFFVKADSPIKTVEDFKGKRVAVRVKTNVSLEHLNRAILATAGLTEADVQSVDSGGVVKGIDMVVEGRADSASVALNMPALRKAHSGVPGGIRIVGLGKQASDELLEKGIAGARTMRTHGDKSLSYIEDGMTVAAFDSFINLSATVSAEDAYRMAKAIHTNWTQFQKDYAPARNVPVDQIAPASSPMPYHPGAVRYYKEAGLWSAAHDKQEAKLKAMK